MKNPGAMDQIVTLRAPQTTVDKFGQHTVYAVVADVAARVKPLQGREFFAAGSMQSPASMEVEIYYRPDVQPNWRLSWMGQLFNLVAAPIDANARHETLLLMCAQASA